MCNVKFFCPYAQQRHVRSNHQMELTSDPSKTSVRRDRAAYQCVDCSVQFSSVMLLLAHAQSVHKSQKPFACNVCGNRYGSKQVLSWHSAKHTGERRFTCSYCECSFKYPSALSMHETLHCAEKVLGLRCSVCSKNFSSRQALRTHNLIHLEQKPVQCPVCGKQMRQATHLVQHMRVHTGERPHRCELCEKSYKVKADLHLHCSRVHQIELPKQVHRRTNLVTDTAGVEFVDSNCSRLQAS
jgi:KRAB domain-containing zinc finger protein